MNTHTLLKELQSLLANSNTNGLFSRVIGCNEAHLALISANLLNTRSLLHRLDALLVLTSNDLTRVNNSALSAIGDLLGNHLSLVWLVEQGLQSPAFDLPDNIASALLHSARATL